MLEIEFFSGPSCQDKRRGREGGGTGAFPLNIRHLLSTQIKMNRKELK